MIRVIEGFETVMFKSKFDTWAEAVEVAVSEDGRGKVAGQSVNFFTSEFSCFIFNGTLLIFLR